MDGYLFIDETSSTSDPTAYFGQYRLGTVCAHCRQPWGDHSAQEDYCPMAGRQTFVPLRLIVCLPEGL